MEDTIMDPEEEMREAIKMNTTLKKRCKFR